MREILFRGKRIDNGEWVEGNYCHFKDNGDRHLIAPVAADAFPYEVDPDTVGQYTGLTDKNGKKIWEGDIVLVNLEDSNGEKWSERKKVHYNAQECCWYPMRWHEECEFCEGYTEITSIEVLGNVHDNPELLKGGEG